MYKLSKLNGSIRILFLSLSGTEMILNPKTFIPFSCISINPSTSSMSLSFVHETWVYSTFVFDLNMVITSLCGMFHNPLCIWTLTKKFIKWQNIHVFQFWTWFWGSLLLVKARLSALLQAGAMLACNFQGVCIRLLFYSEENVCEWKAKKWIDYRRGHWLEERKFASEPTFELW